MTEVRVYNAEARVVMTEARIRCAEKHALYVVLLIANASSFCHYGSDKPSKKDHRYVQDVAEKE